MRGIVDLISQDTNLGERHFFVKNCPNHCNKGRSLRRMRPVRVEFHADRSAVLSQRAHCELGHLAGVTGGEMPE